MKARRVSVGCNIKDPSEMLTFSLGEVLDGIGDVRTRDYVESYQNAYDDFVRSNGLKEEYEKDIKPLKANIPYCTFSGSFSHRKNESLIKHSNVILIDIDNPKLWDAETPCLNVEYWRERLKEDSHVLFFFRSPTNGFKLGFVKGDDDKHLDSYVSAMTHCRDTYGLPVDESGKDVSRACFLNYDPDVWINWDAVQMPIIEGIEPRIKFTKIVKNSDRVDVSSNKQLGNIHTVKPLGWIEEKRAEWILDNLNPSVWDKGDYDDWLKVGMALHFQFNGNRGALKLWESWSDRANNGCSGKWHTFNNGGSAQITFTSLMTKKRYGSVVSDDRDDLIEGLILRFESKNERIKEYNAIGRKMSDRNREFDLMDRI